MNRRHRAFTVLEVLIVVTILGIIIAIAVPTFFRAREGSRMRGCQENLQKIDGAKNQWALETNADAGATPDWDVLVGPTAFIARTPVCAGGGEYTIGSLADLPSCTLSTQSYYPHTFEAN